MPWQSILYLVGAVTLIGLLFFFLMRSADKKLKELNPKSKKRK